VARGASELLTEALEANEEAAESKAVRVARSAVAGMVEQAVRTDTIARARLAESRGNFEDASRLYAEAAQVESELKDRMRGLLLAFFGDASKGGALVDQGFEAEARAAHFAGMAAINLADAALMDGDQQGARSGYQDAHAKLERSAVLWDEARARRPPGPRANEAARQAQVSTLRGRYCDCKIELAQAERLIALRDHLGAAQKFIEARTVLQELVERSLDVDEGRNQQILLGSKFYADARSLFEIDLDSGSDENLRKARQRMGEAATNFASVGEARWAAFIRAQSAECEAQVLQAKAEGSPADPAREVLLSRASDRRQDAADIYAQAGTARQEAAGGNADARPGQLVLPKPQAPIGDAGIARAASANPRRDDDSRTAKIARRRALEETIAQTQDLSERGQWDPARLMMFLLPYREEVNLIKLELEEATS
jgi:hypothetical protein